MKVLVSGSTGLVGRALVDSLVADSHDVVRLRRPVSSSGDGLSIAWDPAAGTIDADALAEHAPDAVVHLAGENIAAGRWTSALKARIRDSRVQGTRILTNALARLEQPPKVFVGASAIGFYGDRGDEVLTEESDGGEGFLAEVCREWEAAVEPVRSIDVRVVLLRIGMVVSKDGGAIPKMLLPFKLGLGGRVASGKQYVSWIALEDLVRIIRRAIDDDGLVGAVNAVSPVAVTNLEMTQALGRVLKRPTIFPMPGFAARLVIGEMADELLIASARVKPGALESIGFEFRFSEFEKALAAELG